MMKPLLLSSAFLCSLHLCFAQTLTIKDGTLLTQPSLLFSDSVNLYFKKPGIAYPIYKIPLSQVTSPLYVQQVKYHDWNDAMFQFNKSNSTGVACQLFGVAVAIVGGVMGVSASQSDDLEKQHDGVRLGRDVAILGGVIGLIGLGIELDSHKHIKRMNIIATAVPYTR